MDKLSDIEYNVLANKVHKLIVNKPLRLWQVTGSEATSSTYNGSRLYRPTAKPVKLRKGAIITSVSGSLYLDPELKTKLVWSNPADREPFENPRGPGALFGLAQKVLDGTFMVLESTHRKLQQVCNETASESARATYTIEKLKALGFEEYSGVVVMSKRSYNYGRVYAVVDSLGNINGLPAEGELASLARHASAAEKYRLGVVKSQQIKAATEGKA